MSKKSPNDLSIPRHANLPQSESRNANIKPLPKYSKPPAPLPPKKKC